MKKTLNRIGRITALLALMAAGCTTTQRERVQRQYDRLPWRAPAEQPPATPDVPDVPKPPVVEPEQPPVVEQPLMQWYEHGGRVILRIRAHLQPRGYSVITAHGHKHIDPASTDHDDWMRANNARPPHRIVDGWAEWTLPWSMAEYSRRAMAFGMGSGDIVMVFCKRSPSGDISFFIRPNLVYGTGVNTPVMNVTNQEWRQVR